MGFLIICLTSCSNGLEKRVEMIKREGNLEIEHMSNSKPEEEDKETENNVKEKGQIIEKDKTITSALGYKMQFDDWDKVNYTYKKGKEDYYTLNLGLDPQLYPEVSMSVTFCQNKKSADSYKKKGKELINEKITMGKEQYEAFHYVTIGGYQWNDWIQEIYIIQLNQKQYVITLNYFVEAEEGWGRRFHKVVDNFQF